MSMQEASQMSNSSSGMMMSHASGMSSVNNNSITSNQNKDNCKVVVRVRPPLPREIEDNRFISTVIFISTGIESWLFFFRCFSKCFILFVFSPFSFISFFFPPQIQVSPDGKKICIYEYYNIELVEADQL